MSSADVIRLPLQADHPSWYIKEELDARGWTLNDLALRMKGDFDVNRLALDFYLEVGPTAPNMRIGKETAYRLGIAFNVSPDYFLNLETAWRKRQPDTKATQ
jgi:hypothetical protein